MRHCRITILALFFCDSYSSTVTFCFLHLLLLLEMTGVESLALFVLVAGERVVAAAAADAASMADTFLTLDAVGFMKLRELEAVARRDLVGLPGALEVEPPGGARAELSLRVAVLVLVGEEDSREMSWLEVLQ